MAQEPETTDTEEAAPSEHMSVEQAAEVGAASAAAKDDPEQAEAIADQREEATGSRVETTGGATTPSPIEAEMARAAQTAELLKLQEEQQANAESAAASSSSEAPATSSATPLSRPAAPSTPPSTSGTSSSSSSSTSGSGTSSPETPPA